MLARQRDVELRRALPAPPSAVWEFLVAPDGLATWLGRPNRNLDVPGPATVAMSTPTGEVAVELVVERVDPPHALTFLWRWPGESTSLVELSLEPAGSGCVLSLRHARLDAALHDDYRTGWSDHLDRLADALTPHQTSTGEQR